MVAVFIDHSWLDEAFSNLPWAKSSYGAPGIHLQRKLLTGNNLRTALLQDCNLCIDWHVL